MKPEIMLLTTILYFGEPIGLATFGAGVRDVTNCYPV